MPPPDPPQLPHFTFHSRVDRLNKDPSPYLLTISMKRPGSSILSFFPKKQNIENEQPEGAVQEPSTAMAPVPPANPERTPLLTVEAVPEVPNTKPSEVVKDQEKKKEKAGNKNLSLEEFRLKHRKSHTWLMVENDRAFCKVCFREQLAADQF